jgi:hypothetical protein
LKRILKEPQLTPLSSSSPLLSTPPTKTTTLELLTETPMTLAETKSKRKNLGILNELQTLTLKLNQ